MSLTIPQGEQIPENSDDRRARAEADAFVTIPFREEIPENFDAARAKAERDAIVNEYATKDEVRKTFAFIVMIIMRAAGISVVVLIFAFLAAFLVLFGSLVSYMVYPENTHWLNEKQIKAIVSAFFSGGVGAVIWPNLKRATQKLYDDYIRR